MARLTAGQRKSMPQSEYALPGKRFPVNDKSHAVAAERLVGRAVKAGSITSAQAQTVRERAVRKLNNTNNKATSRNSSSSSARSGRAHPAERPYMHLIPSRRGK